MIVISINFLLLFQFFNGTGRIRFRLRIMFVCKHKCLLKRPVNTEDISSEIFDQEINLKRKIQDQSSTFAVLEKSSMFFGNRDTVLDTCIIEYTLKDTEDS